MSEEECLCVQYTCRSCESKGKKNKDRAQQEKPNRTQRGNMMEVSEKLLRKLVRAYGIKYTEHLGGEYYMTGGIPHLEGLFDVLGLPDPVRINAV